MSDIKYRYSVDVDGCLVSIDKIDKKTRMENTYKCIACEKELIPRLGEVRQHHFAHKDASIVCLPESYLRKLSKIWFMKIFNESDRFILRYIGRVICNSDKKCVFYKSNECWDEDECSVDIRPYYNKCSTIKQSSEFDADLILEPSTEKGDPIYIIFNIYVDGILKNKRDLLGNVRYIVFDIYSENDVCDYIKLPLMQSDKCRLVNFKFKSKRILNKRKLNRLRFYSSGKMFCNSVCCNDDKPSQYRCREFLIEQNVTWYEAAITIGIKYGLLQQSCVKCKYFRFIGNYDDAFCAINQSQPVLGYTKTCSCYSEKQEKIDELLKKYDCFKCKPLF